jgi:hypothetical protein
MFVAGLAGCAYVAWVATQPAEEVRPFNAIEWEKSVLLVTSNDPGCFRGGMALNLIERKILVGKTRTEIASLLGTPESSTSGTWLYAIGQCGFLWGDNWLELNFGGDAKVARAVFK